MTFGLSAAAIGGLAAGAGAIGGALISSNASKSAANTQVQSEDKALAQNRDIFNTQVGLQEPWRQAGVAGLSQLNTLLGLGAPPAGGGGITPTRSVGPQILPGAGTGAQMLTQGADGVFAPPAATPQLAAATPVPAGPAGTALTQLGLSDRFNVSPDGQSFVSRSTGQAIPLSYFTSGQYEGQAQTGNFGQYQQSIVPPAPAAPAAAAAPLPPPNDFSSFGSLNQPFSAGDMAADPAPKIAPFTPNPVPAAQYGQAAPPVPTFSQFQDLPAFSAAAMKDDPGYQFRADQQQKALAAAASAQGRFGSGSYLKDAMARAGDLASQEYGASFGRYQTTRNNLLQDYTTNLGTQQQNYGNARSAYDTGFNQYQVGRTNAVNDNKDAMGVYSLNRNNALQDFQGAYDRSQTQRSNVLNPLLTVSGFGQQAATQTSGAAQNFGNQAAAAITGAGNARAAGQVGSANAVNGAIGQGLSLYQTNQLLNRFPMTTGYAGGVTPPNPYYTG